MVVGAVRLFPRLQQALTQFRHLRRELSLARGRGLHMLEAGCIKAGRKRRRPGAQQTRADLLGAFLQGNPQTAGNERASQFCTAEFLRARPHQLIVEVRRNIVVVAIESMLTDARSRGELVQFRQGHIGNEVREDGAVRGPGGRVNVDAHSYIVGAVLPPGAGVLRR